jgi:hypothetical protein
MGLTMRGKSGPPQVSARRCPLLLIRPVRRPRTLVPRLIACRGLADVPTMELCSQREPPRVLRRERHDGRCSRRRGLVPLWTRRCRAVPHYSSAKTHDATFMRCE